MSDEPVLTERRDGVLLITLNRPDARNAVNAALAQGLGAALDTLDAEPDLTVGVLTGAGKGFSAGMDLKAFVAGESPRVEGRGFAGIVERSARKPLIAAIEGFAVAGGLEIALACDLVVASREARLGIPEAKRALVAAGGALRRLPQRIPLGVALEMALTGDPITRRARVRARARQPGDRAGRRGRRGARAGRGDRGERPARAGRDEGRSSTARATGATRSSGPSRPSSPIPSSPPRTRARGRSRSARSATRCGRGADGGRSGAGLAREHDLKGEQLRPRARGAALEAAQRAQVRLERQRGGREALGAHAQPGRGGELAGARAGEEPQVGAVEQAVGRVREPPPEQRAARRSSGRCSAR